ncbi:MAG: hypothetical protein HY785_14845 [Oscillatoriophycideae cyanobacterium NC_groundwater_1537_Pr4_S-0.65um_50_18]|nr:hypothetical protein [Oscillatoriophycideae cyanobacterium NC_groundwater_1537_Pr4_S-0.65um_50_18]
MKPKSRPTPPVKVSIWVDELQPRRRGGALLAIMGIGAIGLLGWGSWLAVRLIVNPGSVSWINEILPEWGRFALAGSTTQTWAEIAAEAAQSGLALGKPIAIGAPSAQDILLPILAPQSRCRDNASANSACHQIVELRAYRPQKAELGKTKFEQIDQLKVTGLEELMAIAPLKLVANPGSSRKLPLTQVALMEGTPPDAAIWLHLSGNWQRGSAEVKYGQLVRYDPRRDRLQTLLSWTSPAGQLPLWQQVTGSAVPELVINQSVGLEPQFQVYQVKLPRLPGEPLRLEAITLIESVSNQPHYVKGLLLARNGLWSLALKLLAEQATQPDLKSAAVQAQIDFIALHAHVTQAQADRNWASPTQAIAALAIDGRWAKALEALRSARISGYDIKSLLAANAESLQRRVDAALRANPNQPLVRQWGALTVASQRDRSAAMAWLRQHPLSSAASTSEAAQQGRSPADPSIQQILALLDPLPIAAAPQNPGDRSITQPTSLQLIGAVSPLSTVRTGDWYSPHPWVLPDRQAWYQIEILGLQTGQQWQRSPFDASELKNLSVKALWQRLGLASEAQASPDAQVQIVDGSESGSTTASIKALRWSGGRLQLLAAASPLPQHSTRPPIALTLPWLNPIDRLTLASLSQQQPQQTTALVQALEQQLQQVMQRPSTAQPAEQEALADKSRANEALSDEALAQIENWQIDRMELTGEGQPESVVTVETERHPELASVRTLIFSNAGAVLYSDLTQPDQTIAAIVASPSGVPILIVQKGQTHQIRQWSQSRQKFD